MWLLENHTLDEIRALGPEARAVAVQGVGAFFGDSSGITEKINGTARINITGILASEPHWAMMILGGTTYPEIQDAIAAADADPEIDDIELLIDSPGGSIKGYLPTHDAIRSARKPTTAIVSGMAASAAYGLASAADRIIASSRADLVGSIGVAQDLIVFPEEVSIASTEAPKKRPDVRTEEGKAIVREELDCIHAMFAGSIAEGRTNATGKPVSIADVNKDYGQGAILLAKEALDRGIIDAVVDATATKTATQKTAAAMEDLRMDISKLKAEHPEVYAEAVKIGVAQERDRVGAHLTMGEGCKAMDTAIGAIKSGQDMTATLQAEYMTAGLNARSLNARADDNPAPLAVPAPEAQDMGDLVADLVIKQLGIKE